MVIFWRVRFSVKSMEEGFGPKVADIGTELDTSETLGSLEKSQIFSILSIWPTFGWNLISLYKCVAGVSNLASKLGQIGPKWDKSGTFQDQF